MDEVWQQLLMQLLKSGHFRLKLSHLNIKSSRLNLNLFLYNRLDARRLGAQTWLCGIGSQYTMVCPYILDRSVWDIIIWFLLDPLNNPASNKKSRSSSGWFEESFLYLSCNRALNVSWKKKLSSSFLKKLS